MTAEPVTYVFVRPEDQPGWRPVYLRFWRTGERPTDFTMDFGPETSKSDEALRDAKAAFDMLVERSEKAALYDAQKEGVK